MAHRDVACTVVRKASYEVAEHTKHVKLPAAFETIGQSHAARNSVGCEWSGMRQAGASRLCTLILGSGGGLVVGELTQRTDALSTRTKTMMMLLLSW